VSPCSTGAGIITTTAGATASFNIQPVDAAGLYLPELADGNLLKVAVTEHSVTDHSVADHSVTGVPEHSVTGSSLTFPTSALIGQGGVEPYFIADRDTASIKVYFVATKTGALELTVSVITNVDGFQVTKTIGYPPNGIFHVDVKPGVAVANKSYTDRSLSSYATAGQQHQYQAGGVP